MLTADQLRQITPRLPAQKLQRYLPFLNDAMARFGIDTWQRAAAFIAQLAHESAEFRFMEELWGPTPAQRRYEPPDRLAARLGNTQPGDGRRFKGRGPIQITGRFNYMKYGDLVGVDLVADPSRAATPDVGFATAGLFWTSNRLSELADAGEFVAITRRINGGTNGLADRLAYYERARRVLEGTFVRDLGQRSAPGLPPGLEPLARGHEAIVAAARKRRPAIKTAGEARARTTATRRRTSTTRRAPATAAGGARAKAPKKASAAKRPARRPTVQKPRRRATSPARRKHR